MKFVSERRKFSAQYKDEAVQLVIQSGRPIAQVARELGINLGLSSVM
jgi:transposase-like protein